MLSVKTAAVTLIIVVVVSMIGSMIVSGFDLVGFVYLGILVFGHMKLRN